MFHLCRPSSWYRCNLSRFLWILVHRKVTSGIRFVGIDLYWGTIHESTLSCPRNQPGLALITVPLALRGSLKLWASRFLQSYGVARTVVNMNKVGVYLTCVLVCFRRDGEDAHSWYSESDATLNKVQDKSWCKNFDILYFSYWCHIRYSVAKTPSFFGRFHFYLSLVFCILGTFIIKQLFHSRLLGMRWLWQTSTRGIFVHYTI